MRLITTNLADTGTLTSNSEDTDFPKENVQHPFKAKQYKATGNTDEWMVWDLGSAQTITSVAIVNHNLDSGGTYNFQMHTSDSWATPDVDEVITHDSGIMIKYFTGGSKRYVRFRMQSTAANPAVGRIFFGSEFEPARNFKVTWRDVLVDISKTSSTIEGLTHTDINSKFRSIRLEISRVSLADKNTLLTIIEDVGLSKYFIISLDETNYPNARTFYGKFSRVPTFEHVIVELYDTSFDFMEQP